MRKYFIGVIASTATLLVAGWLMVAPFAVEGFQSANVAWTTATDWSFYTGLGLLLIALLGTAGYAQGIIMSLAAAGVERRPRNQAQSEVRPAGPAPAAVPAAAQQPGAGQSSLEEQLQTQRELMGLLRELVEEEHADMRR